MKNQLRILLVLCFCITTFISSAQDLHIYYDAQNNKTRYEYGGKIVSKPKVRKGGNVFVHVENFNNYLYQLEVETKKKDIQIANSGFTPFSTFGIGGSMGTGGPIEQASDDYGYSDEDGMGEEVLPENPLNLFPINSGVGEAYEKLREMMMVASGFGENSQQQAAVIALKAQFDNLALEMVQTEKQLRGVAEGVEAYKESQLIKEIALFETEKLKYNPTLKPEVIKKLSTEYLKTALEVDGAEDVDLSTLITRSDGRKNLKEKLYILDSKYRTYKGQVEALSDISKQLQPLVSSGGDVFSFQKKVDVVHENALLVNKSVESQRSEILELMNTSEKSDLQTHAELRYALEAISANTFSQTFRANAESDEMKFDLRLNLKDSVAHAVGGTSEVRMAAINVPVFGGFKINASVGVSFGQFFNRPQNYFVRDSVILTEELDAFTPFLTSFLHFYTQSPRNISIGGSIGVGLPLSGDDGIQSASFFLGPCLIIGKGERIVINGGVMGGRVERLGQGFKAGDIYYSDADIVPTRYPYEIGVFLGVSFNLIR